MHLHHASGGARAVDEFVAAHRPRVAIVAGSGLHGLADALDHAVHVPFSDLPGIPSPTVAGHGGELVCGMLESLPVIVQRGRAHLYEGHAPEAVVESVRFLAAIGVDTLIVTNAAGALRTALRPPTLMLIADHVNLTFRSALGGAVREGEERFPDMSAPYDAALRARARQVARTLGIALEEGVYAGVLGPSYETPAEIRMLARFGADAVGMSTVNEVIAARALGLRVLGISAITNVAAGLSPSRLSHGDVLRAGERVSSNLERVVRGVVRTLAGT
ncbi:MAG TPA: purine-nucleoside phosphorylase [Gemmatimonadaceae bacterium]|nr:purine-nucleoside phosphorylase [Gemmatimonadaceae bacterium]